MTGFIEKNRYTEFIYEISELCLDNIINGKNNASKSMGHEKSRGSYVNKK